MVLGIKGNLGVQGNHRAVDFSKMSFILSYYTFNDRTSFIIKKWSFISENRPLHLFSLQKLSFVLYVGDLTFTVQMVTLNAQYFTFMFSLVLLLSFPL